MSQGALPDLLGAPANDRDMLTIAEALRAEGFPTGDLPDGDATFFTFRERRGGLIGFAGLQQRGKVALLRSLVVLPPARARACGSAIVQWMEAEARRRGVDELFLLTTGADRFFEKLGFRRLPRDTAPSTIAATAEFTSLCPSSAVLMGCKLEASPLPEGETIDLWIPVDASLAAKRPPARCMAHQRHWISYGSNRVRTYGDAR